MTNLTQPDTQNSFDQAAVALEQALLNHECEAGRDDTDQRFFASYLLGHLSLTTAQGGDDLNALTMQMEDSLNAAFQVDRLSDQDKQAIQALWQQLLDTFRA